MKNKYFIALSVSFVILIVAAVLFVCFKGNGSSTGSDTGETDGGDFDVYYPIETQPLNMEELIPSAFELAWGEVVSEDDPEYLKRLEQVSGYTIDSITEENGRYLINATVTSPSLGEKLMSIQYSDMPQIGDKEALDDYLCGLIEGLPSVSTQATVYAEWTGERINISFTDEFVDAMCGKVYSYAKNAMIDYLEDNK